MRIWIDLVNSPQVLFFRPILTELKKRGHSLTITSRDFAQTCSLADEYGIAHTPIGRHGGKKWTGIIFRNMGRIIDLCRWVKTQPNIDLAVSHNSYSQAISAFLMRIPFHTLMDYEHQPYNHICFRLANRVIVPDAFPKEFLSKFGAQNKAKTFSAVKEEIYLSDFEPEENFLQNHQIDPNQIIVVVRPPAPWAAYHRFENGLFEQMIRYLSGFKNTTIIFLPRIASQGKWASQLGLSNVVIPSNTINGPNLLFAADLVISGGGTMNREAAVLGTPTYTVFKGKMGAVDKYLIDRNRMTQILEAADIKRIIVQKKISQREFLMTPGLVEQVTDLIVQGNL